MQVEPSPSHTPQASFIAKPPQTLLQSSVSEQSLPKGFPESEQLQNTRNIKLSMTEERIFTGDILMSYTLGKQV